MGKGEGLRSADGRSGDATRSTRDGVDNIAIARRAPALSGGHPDSIRLSSHQAVHLQLMQNNTEINCD